MQNSNNGNYFVQPRGVYPNTSQAVPVFSSNKAQRRLEKQRLRDARLNSAAVPVIARHGSHVPGPHLQTQGQAHYRPTNVGQHSYQPSMPAPGPVHHRPTNVGQMPQGPSIGAHAHHPAAGFAHRPPVGQ